MSKGFLRVASVFMTVFLIAGIFYGCDNNSDKDENVVTDPQGMTYLAIEGSDGKTYAGVTDAAGKLYAAPIDDDGSVRTDGELYEVTSYDGTLPTNDTTAVPVDDTGDGYNYADSPVVTDENLSTSKVEVTTKPHSDNTTDSDKTTKSDNTTKSDKTTRSDSTTKSDNTTKTNNTTKPDDDETELLAEKYKKLFASGTYYIEFSSDDMEEPVTAAVKNENIYMKTKLEGMNCTMIYQSQKDNLYVVLNDYRVYCKMPTTMLDELDMSQFGNSSSVVDVTVYDAKIGDRTCRCEAYKLDNGGISVYYFYKNSLVRMDQISEDGSISVMNISKVSSTVEDSLFELPKGFIPFNLSKLNLDMFDDETTTDSTKK